MTRLQNVLNTFEHLVSFSKPRVMTVGELIDQGVLDLRMGRPKDRYEGTPAKLRERIVTAADVRDDTLRELGIDGHARLTLKPFGFEGLERASELLDESGAREVYNLAAQSSSVDAASDSAAGLATRLDAVVAVSGPVDLITDGKTTRSAITSAKSLNDL